MKRKIRRGDVFRTQRRDTVYSFWDKEGDDYIFARGQLADDRNKVRFSQKVVDTMTLICPADPRERCYVAVWTVVGSKRLSGKTFFLSPWYLSDVELTNSRDAAREFVSSRLALYRYRVLLGVWEHDVFEDMTDAAFKEKTGKKVKKSEIVWKENFGE